MSLSEDDLLKLTEHELVQLSSQQQQQQQQQKRAFSVEKSTIPGYGGFGVFATRPCDAGAKMQLSYLGVRVDFETYTLINDTLWDLTQAPSLPPTACCFGIRVFNQERGVAPNWMAIYDSFIRYLAHGNGFYMYWDMYDAKTGDIVLVGPKDDFAGFFVNEPPPYDRVPNHVSGRMQRCKTNVNMETAGNQIFFVATRKINTGDELFTCYGPLQVRSYEINMSEDNIKQYLWWSKRKFVDKQDQLMVSEFFKRARTYKHTALEPGEKKIKSAVSTEDT